MPMPKTLYVVFVLLILLSTSCSSQKESILVEKKGLINFLEGEIDILISDGNNSRLEPYIFSIFKDAMPDVEFNFINQGISKKFDMIAEIQVNDRFTESVPRSYNYDKCIDFDFKKFKCLDYYNTWMYCKKNSYKTDIGIKIYKAEKVVHLNRELVINYDEDCSESTPVPLSFNDLGIRNDYSVSDWIVGNIATALLEE